MILRILGLAIAWVALWGDISPANVMWGVVVAVVLAWFAPIRPADVSLQIYGVIRLTFFMVKNLVMSSFTVLWTVIRPTPDRTVDSVIRVSLRTQSRTVAVVVANSITLTPGTMTLALNPETFELQVHVLGRVSESEFTDSIWELEKMVARAFGQEVSA